MKNKGMVVVLILAICLGNVFCHIPVSAEETHKITMTSAFSYGEETMRVGIRYDAGREADHGLNNPTFNDGVTTWDCVWFGNYWQRDTNGNGIANKNDAKQPIKWRVLWVDGDDAFLLADKNLDCQKYNDTDRDVTWETCTMRSWLNGYEAEANIEGIDYSRDNFFDDAFTVAEQSMIQTTNVINDDNLLHETEGGNDTSDQVYLLSIDEVMNPDYGFLSAYNKYAESKRAKNTEYAKSQGAGTCSFGEFIGNGTWWLRSPGYISYYASHVDDYGRVMRSGEYVDGEDYAVRPALHLNLKASPDVISTPSWSYAGTVTSEGEEAEVAAPTSTPKPTLEPTLKPTSKPTETPTQEPSEQPAASPGTESSPIPTLPLETSAPTEKPDVTPTSEPSAKPTEQPTAKPTEVPTEKPTLKPTEEPSAKPTEQPTEKPTEVPTEKPTLKPTEEPSAKPTEQPTEKPTESPTSVPPEESTPAPPEKSTPTPLLAETSAPTPTDNRTSPVITVPPSVSPVVSVPYSAVPAVTSIVAKAERNASVRIRWNSLAKVSGYTVFRSKKKTDGYRQIANVPAARTKWRDKSVKEKCTYYYRVAAYRVVQGTKIYGACRCRPAKITMKLRAPVLTAKKKTSNHGQHYIQIKIKKHRASGIELWGKMGKGSFRRISLKGVKANKKTNVINVRYSSKNQTFYIRARIYQNKKKKRYTSYYSKVKRIRL